MGLKIIKIKTIIETKYCISLMTTFAAEIIQEIPMVNII
jgi:hypothetical protein